MSQDALILAHLKAGHLLTPAIAAEKWRCLALHSAIARLRKAGYRIICTWRSGNGRVYGEYRISEPAQLPLDLAA